MFSAETIAARVREMGAQIAEDFAGETITVICVLKGSFLFTADLVRAMPDHDVEVLFLGVTSYAGTKSTGAVRITHDLHTNLAGKHCLIVEDIVDTGLTLRYLRDILELRDPARLKIASLLDKPSRRKVAIQADYTGFVIPDEFVIGYGLDYDQRYRNLPYIGVLTPGDEDL
jgi:hypoxanthine phosphoribosyltransferase